jgi:hypothetical protein
MEEFERWRLIELAEELEMQIELKKAVMDRKKRK